MTTEKLLLEMNADVKDLIKGLDRAEKGIDELNKSTDDTNKELKEMSGKSKKAGNDLDNLGKDADKTGSSLGEMAGKAGKVAGSVLGIATAVAGAATAFVAYAKVQAQVMRETKAMADAAGVSVDEFKSMSFALQTVGFDAEKFGDITKDTQERIGDFLATGGGPFQDFADVMGYTKDEATALAKEFESLSGPQVLQEMVNRMEQGDISAQRMSFALEGMASDTTRLIPLLQDGGAKMKALNEQFDSINVELSEEERAQFEQLAQNVDLAQTAFVNFLNNAITPFLPLVSDAAQALADFFATAQMNTDLDDIFESPKLLETMDSVKQLEKLQIRAAERVKEAQEKQRNAMMDIGGLSDGEEESYRRQIEEAEKLNALVQARLELLNQVPEVTQPETGTLTTDTGGEDGAVVPTADNTAKLEALQAELEAEEQASMSRLELLESEREARLAIARAMVEDKQELKALEDEIEQSYEEKRNELVATEDEKRQEQFAKKLAEQQEFLNNKLITEEEYQQRLNELTAEYRPQDLDSEVLQEQYDAELDALKEQLNNKLIANEEYLQKLNGLDDKYKKKDEDRKKKAESWTKSEVKNNLDAGTKILGALGGNSKKAFKIKQGLSAASTIMNTSEGITKALADQNYAGAAVTAATGAAQLAAILSASPDGGGGSITPPSSGGVSSSDVQPADTGTAVSVTEISDFQETQQTERFVIEFSDDVVDAVARKVQQAENDGRI